MKRKTILILGDSTSMTIGMEKDMYPFHLADMKCWAENTQVVNCSLPGITSADASAFFFRNKNKFEDLKAVIIYLGNCDAMSSELHKGKYSFLKQSKEAINFFFARKKEKARLKNRLLHFEWNNSFDGAIEKPESSDDYEYNISRVVSTANKEGIPVVLIRPQAHVSFPSGAGKGNFVFYKYLGINDKIFDRISIEDSRFKNALKFHENQEFEKASEVYKEILIESGSVSVNPEYSNVVVNNYAVCMAETKSFEEARYLLNLLLKERGSRKEIFLYNLAQIARLRGDIEEYKRLLNESYESDKSMYRVREPYKLAIDRISNKFKNVSVVNLKDFINDEDFVDHCHPLPGSQVLIAERVAEKLQVSGLKGDYLLEIENQLYNPEYSLGNLAGFHAYFKTFAPFSSEEIKGYISKIKEGANGKEISANNWDELFEELPKTIGLAFKYYLRHPCFPELQDAINASPCYPSDVGRFPEYFLFRYLIPYLREFEKINKMSNSFFRESSILRRADDFVAILPDEVNDYVGDLNVDFEYEKERLPAILQKVRTMLIEHLRKGNQINERLKTTIFWYFRETLRFGSHSRISMRYERVTLEFIAEGLAVSGVLDLKMGGEMCDEIQYLITLLEKTVKTHEYFCKKFSLDNDCQDLLKEYDLKLIEISREVENGSSLEGSYQDRKSEKCLS